MKISILNFSFKVYILFTLWILSHLSEFDNKNIYLQGKEKTQAPKTSIKLYRRFN